MLVPPSHLPSACPERRNRAELFTWLLIAALVPVVLVGLFVTGISLSLPSVALSGAAAVATFALSLFYTTRRPEPRIAAALTALAQIIVFSALGATFSYLIATRGGTLWDADLVRYDRMLGFDWHRYHVWAEERPLVRAAFTLAYASLKVQMILAVALLGLTGRLLDLRSFVLAVVMSGLAAITISGFMPAFTMYEYLPLGTVERADAVGEAYVHALQSLRAGTFPLLDLAKAEGIVAFPSYHAALGLIFVRALWSVPWARWPTVALNALLIAATPLDGGHFLVDVLGGLAIALVMILALPWASPRVRLAQVLVQGGATGAGRSTLPAAG